MVAIVFSFVGDLLMAEKLSITSNRIINGTIGFGIAHLFYMIGFWRLGTGSLELYQIIFGVILANSLFYVVAYGPEIKKELLIATYLYANIIGALFVAILRLVAGGAVWDRDRILPLVGIILFVISDSIIARNAFKRKVPYILR